MYIYIYIGCLYYLSRDGSILYFYQRKCRILVLKCPSNTKLMARWLTLLMIHFYNYYGDTHFLADFKKSIRQEFPI